VRNFSAHGYEGIDLERTWANLRRGDVARLTEYISRMPTSLRRGMKAYHLPPDAQPPPVWRLSRPNVRARIRRMDTRALAQIYKLNPTTAQRVAFRRLTGCRRYVYNWALARRREHYAATGTHLSSAALSRELTALKHHPDTAWLAEVDSQALQQALRDADRAYANFFAGRAGRPRFASRHRGDRTAHPPAGGAG